MEWGSEMKGCRENGVGGSSRVREKKGKKRRREEISEKDEFVKEFFVGVEEREEKGRGGN